MSWRRCVGTTKRRYGQKRSTRQESLLPLSEGGLRTFFIQKTSKKFQQCSLLPLLLLFPLLSNPPPPRPLFLLLKSQKGLARLVTKTRGLRWPRVMRPSSRVLSPRIRVKVRRSNPRPRPRTPRMLSQSRMWSPRPRKLSLNPKKMTLNPRQLTPKRTLPMLRHSSRSFLLYFFVLFSLFFSFFFFWWQFNTVYNVPSF